MEKDWKFLIENRFQNRDRKFFENFQNFRKKSRFSDFFIFFENFLKNFNLNPTFFDFRFFENFRKKMKKSKNLDFFENFENFSISILKSIFDQKFSIFFHDLFFKPLKNQLENPHVKARSPENAMWTREKSKRADRLLCKKKRTLFTWKDTLKKNLYTSFPRIFCFFKKYFFAIFPQNFDTSKS